ncbi:hypothetical protein [Thermanaerovibrio acidaminovorans]|nr:hypothetical protein [Thermanaerovibrio acidaminovorans]
MGPGRMAGPSAAFGQVAYTIRLPMEVGALAEVLYPDGSSESMGKVRVLPVKTRYPGFTASRLGEPGSVVASGANAHHILVDVERSRGRTLSVIPSVTFVAAAGNGSSMVIEGVGGVGLWGRLSPPVGSRVYVVNRLGYRIPFRSRDLLKVASALEIDVEERSPGDYVRIENWEGGGVFLGVDRREERLGTVEKPFHSSGRFLGTLYQTVSAVRANHPGVICVSTTQVGDIGGFQIVPLTHMYDDEMQKSRNMGQWLIVRGDRFQDLAGTYPLFSGVIRPFDREGDSPEGRVLCRIGDGPWIDLPEASGVQEGIFQDVTEIKILLR